MCSFELAERGILSPLRFESVAPLGLTVTNPRVFSSPLSQNEKSPTCNASETFAEREGFEPPVPLGTTVFKTVVIDHSTISPWR